MVIKLNAGNLDVDVKTPKGTVNIEHGAQDDVDNVLFVNVFTKHPERVVFSVCGSSVVTDPETGLVTKMVKELK